jgi:ABC-2 type transport system ATP-binding protein
MRRRLDLAATLVARPQVLFLDEPTTGLDPRARTELWEVLDTLVDSGTTLLLTTQYLDEAERLADDIIVIDRGRVIARGDSRSLKREVGGDHIYAVIVDPSRLDQAAAIVGAATGGDPSIDTAARSLNVPTTGGVDSLVTVATEFRDAGIAVEDLSIRQPTLDDVFLTLTGEPCPDEVDDQEVTS